MDIIREKIRVMVSKLDSLRTLSSTPLESFYAPCPAYKTTNTPPEQGWQPFSEGQRFGGIDEHFWLRLSIPSTVGFRQLI